MVRIKLDDSYKEFNKVYPVRVITIIIIERMLVFKGMNSSLDQDQTVLQESLIP